ncbi:hypothetical protein AVT10_15575 [Sphingomonas hankookensis]|uniref:HTH iclR-type domain-containing protein n=2 Tax=Sphingomonadaceae TaxID=41297 RepID=A0ABR5YCJ9_9SPHN|nr:hypothetical protein AVT10_15575 [Sphingomonas hankookensis]
MAFIGDWPAMTAKLVENWNRKHAARKPLQAANDGVLRTVPEGGLVARKGITARDLMQKDFPPVTWIVPNIAPEGLTILAGAPKVGKSWLALGIAVAVAEGTETLGGIKCDRGRVLYLALEDNQRRLAGRMRMMGKALGPEKLDLMTEWPMVGEGCVEEMEIWADSHPDARLIVVDVFAKVKSSKGGSKPQYELDYKDVSALQHFAIERGLGLILVHHTRKMESDDPFDSVSGTRGLTGSADSTIVLTKGFGNENSGLYGRGRDIEEFEKTVLFDRTTCQWRIAGNIIAPAATPEQQAILDVLSDADEPMAAGDIARAVGKSSSNTSQLLTKLIEGGRVAKVAYGKFAVAAPGNLAFLREPQV